MFSAKYQPFCSRVNVIIYFFINDRFSIWSYFHTVTIYLLIIAVVADGLLQVFGQRIVGQATLGPTESLLQHVVLPRLTRDIIALQE